MLNKVDGMWIMMKRSICSPTRLQANGVRTKIILLNSCLLRDESNAY